MKENIFLKIVPVQDGFDADQVIASGYHVPDLIRRGYKYIAGEDRYVRSKNKLILKPAGWLTLGLITVAAMEVIKPFLK